MAKTVRNAKPGNRPVRSSAKTKKDQSGETCVVLMPFREPFDTYYATVIKPAVLAASLSPIRADSLFRPSPIMSDLWQMIQDSTVLVADLTGKNPNVYYELGLAHAIGKPVVLISESMDDVPFDLQSLRIVTYDKNNPTWGSYLKADIEASLRETLEDPIDSVPSMFRKKVESQAPAESETVLRLEALEREVRALRREPGGWHSGRTRTVNSLDELRAALNEGRIPLNTCVEVVKSALQSGLSKDTVEEESRSVATSDNFQKIMKAVNESA